MESRIFKRMPNLDYEEVMFLENLSKDLDDDQLDRFLAIYNGKRKSKDTILICGLLGFVGVAGIERFIVGQIGMGILFLLTGGLCLIGTIVDLVNHKQLAMEFNQKMAAESIYMTKAMAS